jgi:glycine/D-amino acid oxidase-like deaminating enzyme
MAHVLSTHPSLAFNVRVDALVIGGGLAGVTAAYLIKRAGGTVALVERQHCGAAEVDRLAVHATAVPRAGLNDLIDRIGPDRARGVCDAGFAAIARLRANVRDERINCGFAWLPGYLYASPDVAPEAGRAALWREATAAAELGVAATQIDAVPGIGWPGLLFEGQARLQPLNYLTVLVDRIPGSGSYVFEDTAVDSIDGRKPFVARSGLYRLTADHLVLADPEAVRDIRGIDLSRWTALQDLRHAVVSGTAPAGELVEGLYWEHLPGATEYLRVDGAGPQAQVTAGGHDRQAADRDPFAMLARRLGARLPRVRFTHRWTGREAWTPDRLPYIGEVAPRQFAVAGLGDNDLTWATLAGMMAADAVSDRANPWRDLFAFHRAARERTDAPFLNLSSA